MNLTHTVKAFQELSLNELYALLKLRVEVFAVEQNCVYQDLDGKDQVCYHVMLHLDDELVGYSRLVPAGVSYAEVAIGRVITAASVRGKGFGRTLMEYSIQNCHKLWGEGPIRLSAQVYAKEFYDSLGFVAEGEEYLEDGIPHIEMLRE